MGVIHTLAELDDAFGPGRPRFLELWIEAADGATLTALVNGDSGWLMYLRENGDPGFSSRNPAYAGPADGTIRYRLDNGQVDECPARRALPLGDVKSALRHFLLTGAAAPWIVWQNDSGDGVVIGRPG